MPISRAARPTMLDVAKMAGVSYQTVSRVINNQPYVSTEARQRVQDAIETLGYHPSKAAAKLASKSSKTIAIIIYGSWFSGPMQIALNVEIAAKTSGFDVILTNITEPKKQLIEALKNVNAWAVDGILMILPVKGLPFAEVQSICGATPVIQIDAARGEAIPSIVTDDASGMAELIEHLAAQGHTRFCLLNGPLNWFGAQTRYKTVIQTLEAHNLEPLVTVASNWTAPGGYQVIKRLLKTEQSFSAIVAANDSMAFGALFALQEAGLSVPGDISLTGYDDVPEAAYYNPPLTTIRQNYIKLGLAGFEYLVQLMDDPETQVEQRVISPTVIYRHSTGVALSR